MPRKLTAQPWTAAEIARRAAISSSDVQHARLQWTRDAKRDARTLLDADAPNAELERDEPPTPDA